MLELQDYISQSQQQQINKFVTTMVCSLMWHNAVIQQHIFRLE